MSVDEHRLIRYPCNYVNHWDIFKQKFTRPKWLHTKIRCSVLKMHLPKCNEILRQSNKFNLYPSRRTSFWNETLKIVSIICLSLFVYISLTDRSFVNFVQHFLPLLALPSLSWSENLASSARQTNFFVRFFSFFFFNPGWHLILLSLDIFVGIFVGQRYEKKKDDAVRLSSREPSFLD